MLCCCQGLYIGTAAQVAGQRRQRRGGAAAALEAHSALHALFVLSRFCYSTREERSARRGAVAEQGMAAAGAVTSRSLVAAGTCAALAPRPAPTAPSFWSTATTTTQVNQKTVEAGEPDKPQPFSLAVRSQGQTQIPTSSGGASKQKAKRACKHKHLQGVWED
jgi:hypothetical protein